MSFLGCNGGVPLALLVGLAYILGAAAGGGGRQLVRAAASIMRRGETKRCGLVLN
jgi:hypothetical protein